MPVSRIAPKWMHTTLLEFFDCDAMRNEYSKNRTAINFELGFFYGAMGRDPETGALE